MTGKNAFSERVIKEIVKVYIIISLLICFISRIMPIKQLMGENLNSILFYFLAIAGVLILSLDYFKTKYWKKAEKVEILYLFILVMIISSILNYEYGIIDNAKTIIWMCILIGLVYTFAYRCSTFEILSFLEKIWSFFCVAWIIPIIISIYQFSTLERYRIEIEGKNIRQGFYDNRLFGIFNDPNYAAVVSVYVVFASIYLYKKATNKEWKVFLILNIIVQCIYIVLSGSRTALVCICVTTCFIFLIKFYQEKQYKNILKRVLICVLIPIIVVSSVFIGERIIQKTSMILPITYIVVVQGETDYKSYLDAKMLKREDVNNENITNNRMTIWKAYLSGIKGDFIFGGSPRNVLKKWQDKNPDGYLATTGYETHNAYIHILVGTGIIGMSLILLYVFLFIKSMLAYIKSKKQIELEIAFVLSFLSTIVIYVVFFSDLFFVYSLTSILFWLHCGIAIKWFNKKSE